MSYPKSPVPVMLEIPGSRVRAWVSVQDSRVLKWCKGKWVVEVPEQIETSA